MSSASEIGVFFIENVEGGGVTVIILFFFSGIELVMGIFGRLCAGLVIYALQFS